MFVKNYAASVIIHIPIYQYIISSLINSLGNNKNIVPCSCILTSLITNAVVIMEVDVKMVIAD